MRNDPVTITASLLLRDDDAADRAHVGGYFTAPTMPPHLVAQVTLSLDPLSEGWREEFRTFCQHVVDQHFENMGQGVRVQWMTRHNVKAQAE